MILVTGASGLLGASIVLQASAERREVAGLYLSHRLCLPGIPMFQLDVAQATESEALVEKLRPTAIIHCAAATSVDWCEDHPLETERINVGSSVLFAAIARRIGASFVYISTDSVFDGTRGNYSEADEPCPLNIYAISKLQGEREVLRQNPEALIVRVNIYGWSGREKQSLAEWILSGLSSRKQLPGFTDVIFCPILVNKLAELLLRMIDLRLTGVYHATGSEAISKYEFARSLAREFKLDPDLVIPSRLDEAELRAPRPRNVSLMTNKIQLALGRPMPNVSAGITQFKALRDDGYAHTLREAFTEAVA